MKYLLPALVVLVLAGTGWLVSRDNGVGQNTTVESEITEEETTNTTEQPSTETASAGTYIDYSPEAIASTQGTKILFFHAAWCPQCRALEASIKSGEIPTGVTIIKADYDTNQALRQKYGVTIQTTLVKVDDAGQLVEKYVAYDSPTLAAVKKNLLD